MTPDLFHSILPMEEATVKRKLYENNNKVEWLKLRWMHFRKADTGVMYYKTTCNVTITFHSVDFKQKRAFRGIPLQIIQHIRELPL